MLLICCTIKYSEISHRIFIHESCVELRVHFEMRADVEFKITVAHKKQERSPNFNQMIARVITCENDHVIVIGRS